MKQIAVRLPDATYDRLQALAARSGRTATFYIREAIAWLPVRGRPRLEGGRVHRFVTERP